MLTNLFNCRVNSGPDRAPPSRVRNDPRFLTTAGEEIPREQFAAVLLPRWREPHEREAACAILLELAGWRPQSAERLVVSALRSDKSEQEVWITQLRTARANRVKVLRPNPWAHASAGTTITCDTNALSVLASDVIHRTFPALDGSISLNGTSFRSRRVPTFLCSADFGPLGLFKVDSRERVAREATSFTNFAQRLHPRYRASRCDQSIAMISEPDDRVEFVSGLLTSYVFTEREAPRTLSSWFCDAKTEAARRVIGELFSVAVKPWYQHATFGVVDILSEYPVFSRSGLNRLTSALLDRSNDIGTDIDQRALIWISSIVDWVNGASISTTHRVEEHAAALQLCESLHSITHGDLHLDNVLVIGNVGAEYPCLIDFETTGPAHMLRDFGRFTGALLFRTFDWTPEEVEEILRVLQNARDCSFERFESISNVSERCTMVVAVIADVWHTFRLHWRSGSRPSDLEVVATLVASFLPYSRYPDTRRTASRLALNISGNLAASVQT